MKVIWIPQFFSNLWSNGGLRQPSTTPPFKKLSKIVGKNTKPFQTQRLLLSRTRKDEVIEELLNSGASKEKLTVNHVNAYSEVKRVFNEKGWETDKLANHFSQLINAGITPEELETYSDFLFYYALCNCETDTLTNSFLNLVKSNPTEDELQTFKSVAGYHIDNAWEVDKLTESFSKLVRSKPQDDAWNIYKNTVSVLKERNKGLSPYTYYLSCLISAGASKKLLEIYNNSYLYCLEKKLNTQSITKAFLKLAQVKPKDEALVAFEDTVNQYGIFKQDIDNLTEKFAELLKAGVTLKKLNFCLNTVVYYLGRDWDLDNFLNSFIKLIKLKPSKEKWGLYECAASQQMKVNRPLNNLTSNFAGLLGSDVLESKWSDLEYTKDSGFNLDTLVFADFLMQNTQLSQTKLRFYRESIESFKKQKFPLGGLTLGLALIFKDNGSLLLCETFRDALTFHNKVAPKETCDADTKQVVGNFKALANLEPPESMLKTYRVGLLNNQIKSSGDSLRFIEELAVHTAILNLTKSQDKDYVKKLQNFISGFVRNDPVPYPQRDENKKVHPEARRVYNQTLSVYRRAFDFYHGFSSLTFETKRPPTKEPPLLARFGHDVANQIKYINAKDISLFPGRGFVISNIIPQRVFVSRDKSEAPDKKYKEKWGWAKDVFDDFPNAHFIFTRGMIAVTCTGSDKYKLKDVNGKKVHFSYVVFNDHHHNYGTDVAYLIPTEVLRKKLEGATIPYEDYVGFAKSIKDINEVGLTIGGQRKEADLIPANLLNLSWGSNIGGGLCNAYPLDSSPFHLWEIELRPEEIHTKDMYGRVHKSHITGIYLDQMDPTLERLLLPLREAHDQVYRATNSYQNLLDLFRLTLAMWHKGETAGEKLTPFNQSDDDLFESYSTPVDEQWLEYGEEEDYFLNPSSLRLLVEAYKWHDQAEENKNNFPVLAVSETLNYSTKPNSPLILDTYDMKLNIAGEEIQLPSDSNGLGVDEALIWFKHVMPHVKSFSKDLRFYDRRDLGIN